MLLSVLQVVKGRLPCLKHCRAVLHECGAVHSMVYDQPQYVTIWSLNKWACTFLLQFCQAAGLVQHPDPCPQ